VLQALVIERSGGELFFDFAEAGEHAHEALEGAEVLDHFHLIEEVIEVELAGLHPLGGFHGLLFIDLIGDLLDHGDDVSHAEDAVGHAGGVELGEVFDFFTFANVFDGLAGDGAHGEGGTTTGVTIELSEDEAGDSDGGVKGLGDGDGLLAGGGVRDEEGFAGFEEMVEFLELVEE